ncbi:MAG: hypothetical protein C4530_00470 [Desulfobacteraceae bacterium]|nr:MAG: hypothetical protein C4530_00470 [Desulfobacteraceae bacterium]
MQSSLKFKLHFAILALLVAGTLTLVQMLAERRGGRVDITANLRNSISEKSIAVLTRLEAPLRVTAFYGEGDTGRRELETLLRAYASANPLFTYALVNPAKNPGLAQALDVQSHGTLVFEYRSLRKKLIGREEEAITNTVLALTENRPKTVYFLSGHGEKSIEDGYRSLQRALHGENYILRELYLTETGGVPPDAHCLVIAGPRKELIASESAALDRYLDRGGNLLALIDPYSDGGLKPLIEDYGIVLHENSIVDRNSQLSGGEYLFPAVSRYQPHAITRNMTYMSFFPVARSLAVKSENGKGAEPRPLALTSPGSWGETDRGGLLEGRAAFQSGSDLPGPLILAAVTARKLEPTGKESRIAVFGDSDFASDDYLDISGNKDFILNTIAWLAEAENRITLRSRPSGFMPIILTQNQSRLMFWLSLVLLPGLIAAAGAAVGIRSRRG